MFSGSLGWAVKAQSRALVGECSQLAAAVNQNAEVMANFETEIDDFAQNAAQAETLNDIKSAAKQYVDAVDNVTKSLDDLAGELDTLTLTDEQLASYRDEYVVVVTGLNDALASIATAMTGVAETESEAQLPEQIGILEDETLVAVQQINELASQESDIVGDVNAHCGVDE